ncbi:MAG TPA: hypothetical protein VIK50_02345 [Gemmatimonadaceae bacterium]
MPWKFTSWRMCIINTIVNAANPVLVEELDANMNVLAFRTMTSVPTLGANRDGIAARQVTSLLPCQDFLLNVLTIYVRWRLSGSGTSADANAFGGTGLPLPPPPPPPPPQ